MTSLMVMFLCVCIFIRTTFAPEYVLMHCSNYNGRYKALRTRKGHLVGGVARVHHYVHKHNGTLIITGNFIRRTDMLQRLLIDINVLKLLNPTAVILAQNEMHLLPHTFTSMQNEGKMPIACTDIRIPLTQLTITVVDSNVVIFGYSPPNSTNLPLVGILNIHADDPVHAITQMIEVFKETAKEYVFVAAGCVSYEFAKALAKSVNVHIVLSGCSNTMQWNGDEPPENITKNSTYPEKIINAHGQTVLLAHSYGSTKFLGVLKIRTNPHGEYQSHEGEMVYLNHTMDEDSEMLDIIDRIKLAELAHTRVLLNGDCHVSECNFGNLITDALIHYKAKQYTGKNWTDTSIAFIPAGSILHGVDASTNDNKIWIEHLMKVFKPHRQLVTCTMDGRSILRLFDEAIRDGDETNGMFLQVSGVHFRYDFRGKTISEKLKTRMVRCSECTIPIYEPLIRKKTYQLVTTVDMLEGKYGHTFFSKTARVVQLENTTNFNVLSDYLRDIKFVNIGRTDRVRIGRKSLSVTLTMHFICVLLPILVLLI